MEDRSGNERTRSVRNAHMGIGDCVVAGDVGAFGLGDGCLGRKIETRKGRVLHALL